MAKRNYTRHLPHQIPEGFPIFLTWNLKGALPQRVLRMLRDERARLEGLPRRGKKIVEDSILFGVPERYDVFAWCVMSNHVHVLLTPKWELKDVTQGIKGFTAHEINGIQNARGRVFWHDESYDHWARDDDELQRIIQYIEQNPVAAGLCQHAHDWPWSSARFRSHWRPGHALDKSTLAFPG